MKKWLLSCEHGGNAIPFEYSSAFKDYNGLLQSHRGFDIGVAKLYQKLDESGLFDFTLINEYSRLLVDFNRSLHHTHLFSEISRFFSEETKDKLLKDYYLPFRNKIGKIILKWLENGFDVVHVSLHSFTPVLDGVQRNGDFAILYDPGISEEKKLALLLKKRIGKLIPKWKVRFNYPYKGIDDGHVEYYRRNLPAVNSSYSGVEFELNQKLFETSIDWADHFLSALQSLKGDL